MGAPVHKITAAAEAAYEPFAGPITLDTLDALFADRSARFAGFTMKVDDDGDEDGDDDGEDDDTPGLGDDEGDDGEDGDDDGDDDDEPLGKAGKKALLAERARNKALRKRLREATAAAAAKPAKKGGKDDDDDDAPDPEAVAAAKWKPKVVNSAAKAALLSAGAEKPERLLRLIEHDDLEVTDDGDVHGLDDEVDRLKDEYPELFAKPGRRRAAKVETGDRSKAGGTKKPLTATEKQALLLTGKK
jgi:hypothetical protein